MDLALRLELPPFSPAFVDRLTYLSHRVFGTEDADRIRWRLRHMPDVSVFVADDATRRSVGFKAGYAVSERKYYSWLGGVDPDWRRRGVADALMRRQHHWLAERGYGEVETAANQDNPAMTAVNLRHGFRVAGLRVNIDNTQILFLKTLRRDPG